MEDKKLAGILAEMLIVVEETTDDMKSTLKLTSEQSGILKDFLEASVRQWGAQQTLNKNIFEKLESIEKVLHTLSLLEERVKHLESLEERLVKIERLLKAS